jgi:hypothetical protein
MRSALFLLLATACAAGRPGLGEVQFRPYTDVQATPAVFTVQQGRIFNPDLDVTLEPGGCARGNMGSAAVQLCSKADKAPPEKPGDVVEHWAGVSGDVTLELQDQGKRLRMDGYLNLGGRGTIPVQATVPLGTGPQWEELRKHPVLLAIAAAAAGIRGEPPENIKPE